MTELDDIEEYQYKNNQAQLHDILNTIVRSKAVFKSQQKDDPEISDNDKKKIAETLLFDNPVAFLDRFGEFLHNNQLAFFDSFKNDTNGYDIDFYVAKLKNVLNFDSKKKLIRNRRYEALKRLQNGGKYFSNDEMEKREPLLYHQLVGQYLSATERVEKFKNSNQNSIPTFSSFLIQQAEKDATNRLRLEQEEAEGTTLESSADEDDVEEGSSRGGDWDDDPESVTAGSRWGADWEDEEIERKRKLIKTKRKSKKLKLTSDEKGLLMDEFKTCVYTKFIDGCDDEFDYSQVDTNPNYDCLQVRSQDEEEKYFDEETCDEAQCTDTGVQDF